MAIEAVDNIRKSYTQLLAKKNDYNEVFFKMLKKQNDEPIYEAAFLHAEEQPCYLNEARELTDIMVDLSAINAGIINTKDVLSDMITKLDNSVKIIEKNISDEEERINDLNMICGNNSIYNMVIPIKEVDIEDGDFGSINSGSVFYAAPEQENMISYSVVDIFGNGCNNNSFKITGGKNIDTKQSYINDSSDITKFEYSRLFTVDKENELDGIINYDNKNIELILTISAEDYFCNATIISDNNNLVVKKIEISNDGYDFVVSHEGNININSKEEKYYNNAYAYGSNKICFPYCKYVRLTFESNDIFNDIESVGERNNITNIARKAIIINDIKLYSAEYKQANIKSGEMLEYGSIDKIGLFVNEYIPDHFHEDTYIKYWLIINGTEYEIVPLNSLKNGIKIIKHNEDTNIDINNYIKRISETIKSVRVKILIKSFNRKETPYISNIKLCIGKDAFINA